MESGSYTITGGGSNSGTVSIPDAAQRATWSAGTTTYWLLPSVHEWYKAAYYDPNKSGGAGYWDYPNTSDAAPTAKTPADQDGGPNGSANFASVVGYPIDVGSYTTMPTASAYGTYDQGGNVWEWFDTSAGTFRGGSWFDQSGNLKNTASWNGGATHEGHNVGFRVASVGTPPPPAGTLIIIN